MFVNKHKFLSAKTMSAMWLAVLLSVSAAASAKTPMVALPDFSVLAQQNSPVVVNISTTKHVSTVPQQFQGLPDEMLRRFFGIPEGQQPGTQERQVTSLGSGFIISSDGYILTNNHVVDGADNVVVKLSDRKELKAKIIGQDKRTDVAVLKVDATGLPVAKIGSSKDLKVGQWVLAIGEPFGLDYTVTHGIVSAIGRALPDDTYVPFIQTDVPINPGNSGGPLFNMNGEVVGINSQIYSNSGGSMGLSFSIPIDIAMSVAEQLKEKGHVTRGFLGVSVQDVSGDLAKSFGLTIPKGALVAEAVKGTPAEKAGIQAGDIILAFNGQPINKSADLPPIVGATPIGKKVKVKILRAGDIKYVTVVLKPLDKFGGNAGGDNAVDIPSLGARVEMVDPKVLHKLNLPFGVRLVHVENDGPADKAGLMKGDILVTVNFHSVESVAALEKIAKDVPKDRAVPVRVVRGNRSIFLPVQFGK
ncbi:DegQ family serine endoprotease [Hydrogenovibrio sp. JE_KL2]|uniref:DegQ family serine endoprotease n=1 Tax=Hydrogenovibrio sp. JE_KL2 TaxID=2651188 RepID=UPI00128D751F|nr:DegQ family serine endoprotease [Hydrogenovibrio sp. JE_KL2]MPQ75653.1 DegQ family serine endoprotease [Hydrogenovibrio sp. JE_KL2]